MQTIQFKTSLYVPALGDSLDLGFELGYIPAEPESGFEEQWSLEAIWGYDEAMDIDIIWAAAECQLMDIVEQFKNS